MSILIKGLDWVITQDRGRRILRNRSILIDQGKIVQVGGDVRSSADHVIDGRGKAALPGLVNTHTHLSMTLLRGYADDLRLKEWLETKIWPLEKKLTGELCYVGALLGSLEMIRTGTTCFLDMYFYPADVARAAAEAGLRAYVSHAIIDLLDPSKGEDQLAQARDSFTRVRALNNPLVKVAVAPHSPYSCSEESLLAAKEVAVAEDAPLHIHIAETRREQADFENRYGKRVVERLEELGFLCPNVVAAHCVWLTRREIEIMAKRGVKVSHCPVSNMKLGEGGVAPLVEMLESRVTVSLGTDGAASNNCLDMFDTMKTCALLHKAHRWDPTAVPAQETLDLATVGGACSLGISDRVGSLEEGKEADIILIDLRSPSLQPIHGEGTVLSNLVYAAQGGLVDTTIVRGRVLMEAKKVLSLDEERVYRLAEQASEKLTQD
ncbi:MAG: amidohydrolase [Candidatus Bathyarchaeia archaeon]